MNTRLVAGAEPMTVYDGQRLIGTITETRGGYVARDTAGAIVGEFPTASAAARRIAGAGAMTEPTLLTSIAGRRPKSPMFCDARRNDGWRQENWIAPRGNGAPELCCGVNGAPPAPNLFRWQ